MSSSSVILCILDGWGLSDVRDGNAVAQANTPNFDRLMQGPNATLITYGPEVGLPNGQMGNSEVGHMNIGAGRTVDMDLRKIEAAIETGAFEKRPAITKLLNATDQTIHLFGVLSDGGVHADIDHLIEQELSSQ